MTTPPPNPQEPVWTYRGYQLRSSEFTTAMIHFFRAEVQRANVWRQRLDATTNWAVVTTGASISIAFSQANAVHYVLRLNLLLVTLFLYIEARRYKYYELFSYRVRLLETDLFAAMLVPPFHPSPEWAEALAEHLLHPTFPISTWEALGRRLRRNYLAIYLVNLAALLGRMYLMPAPPATLDEFIQRAGINGQYGEGMLLIIAVFYLAIFILALATIGLQQAAGEVLPRYTGLAEGLHATGFHDEGPLTSLRAWFRPTHRRRQLLTLIITDQADQVSTRIMKEMGRGITRLSGMGMYTGQERSVLICALSITEINQLRLLTAAEDPSAFVIVAPAEEIFGKGFMPLQDAP